jgi:hypothetical protein
MSIFESGCEMSRKGPPPSGRRKKRKPLPSDEFLIRDRDPRPLWRRVDANAGLPLWEAMLFYGNQSDARTVDELTCQGFGQEPPSVFHEMSRAEQIEYNVNSMQLEHARRRMEREFLSMLNTDAVFATGYAGHSPLDMPATRVIADRWRLLEPNFDDSTAKGSNIEIAGILIFDGSKPAQAPVLSKAFSAARLREWYKRWVSSNKQNGHLPGRDEDLKAARQALGEGIPRSAVRQLRRELAPVSWKSFGRRKDS